MTEGKTGGAPPRANRAGPRQHTAQPRRTGVEAVRRPPGYVPRAAAARILHLVLTEHRALDDAMERVFTSPACMGLEPRDRAFARLIVVTVLRRHGELDALVKSFIGKPLPGNTGLLWPILLSAAAQLVCLETPPHAAISLAVDQTRADAGARRFDRLANAVLRRVSVDGRARLAEYDAPRLNTPAWMWARWTATYGEAAARAIAAANLTEAALDVSVKSDAAGWAERLGGIELPMGSVRLKPQGRIEDMPGYEEGAWWVQDAAASLPGRLLGTVAGLTIADLCAAPGGKTAELASAGANVTAVDVSQARVTRLVTNLARLRLQAECVTADVTAWQPGRQFDAVLLDAPCTASGTIRRHPDILRLKHETDVAQLSALQAKLLTAAATLVKPGGRLVYCTCSLEPEEGADRIKEFLAANPAFQREQVLADEIGGLAEAITPDGDLRTLPVHLQLEDAAMSGLDGFYAARLRRMT
jgi:16S rRNA (cytosine967-C5)-methyltransferase